jgi:D-lactate dehydrogenase (cytochrome)
VTATQDDLRANNLYGPIIGHVGDGNFHVVLFCDPLDEAEVTRVKGFYERLIHRAISMEGTCTGEHGVGSGKIKFLEAEHGKALAVMRQVKQALDPLNIMNPGKILAL